MAATPAARRPPPRRRRRRQRLPAARGGERDARLAVADGPAPAAGWPALEAEARRCSTRGEPDVWDALTRQFEARLIHTALDITRGRRIEAAQKLGIGRNTITRKIQELGLE